LGPRDNPPNWPDDSRIEIVPGRGLEPLRISPPDPKSGASANFATLAFSPDRTGMHAVYARTRFPQLVEQLKRTSSRLCSFNEADVTAAFEARSFDL
jgi:hypothetical protein